MKLQNLNLTPTMRCNLKCRLCGVLVPQYEYRPQMSVEECAKTLEIMFSLADCVGRLQITGGEPLLHPQLDRLLELDGTFLTCQILRIDARRPGYFEYGCRFVDVDEETERRLFRAMYALYHGLYS